MALATYKKLALRWQPSQKEDRVFTLIAVTTVILMLLFGLYLSSIEVPEKPRLQRSAVPERVAKFISQKEKPKPKPPKPKPPEPKPPEPEPKPEPEKVEVVRDRPKPVDKPLTETQQKARDKAAQSGLLAHLSELNDLVDTSDVSAQVKASIKQGDQGKVAAGHSADILTAGASDGSGGVDAGKYATRAGDSQLGAVDLTAARAALAASDEAFEEIKGKTDGKTQDRANGHLRSEEEISLVFDRHKSQLQSLYNRARRSNPGLRGKLVLAITILPDGSVSAVKVLSSELSDTSLVQKLIARIKNFQFGARDVAVATVTYPIEFLQ